MNTLPERASEFGPDSIPSVKADLRQSNTALDICRGVHRLLLAHGYCCLTELTLANGRRADVVALGQGGEIAIVEIKSSIEDFRTDLKWPEYRDFCDRLYFAVKPDFPNEILPADTGLILADRFAGEIIRPAPETKLAGARRKAMTLRFARAAALRLNIAFDPSLAATLLQAE